MSRRKSRKSFKLRPLLWRWHRRVGVLSALLVIVLCVTGIQLNHIEALGWDEKPVRALWLLKLYGVESPELVSYRAGSLWLTHTGEDQLYRNDRALTYCDGHFVGAVSVAQMVVAACADELILLTPAGDLIERIGAAYQLPEPLDGIGKCANDLCLESRGARYLVDLDRLRWTPVQTPAFEPAQPSALPDSLRQTLLTEHFSGAISWERVVLDLHSGRLFGLGPWLMDIVALLLLALAVSGLWLWSTAYRKQHNRQRRSS